MDSNTVVEETRAMGPAVAGLGLAATTLQPPTGQKSVALNCNASGPWAAAEAPCGAREHPQAPSAAHAPASAAGAAPGKGAGGEEGDAFSDLHDITELPRLGDESSLLLNPSSEALCEPLAPDSAPRMLSRAARSLSKGQTITSNAVPRSDGASSGALGVVSAALVQIMLSCMLYTTEDSEERHEALQDSKYFLADVAPDYVVHQDKAGDAAAKRSSSRKRKGSHAEALAALPIPVLEPPPNPNPPAPSAKAQAAPPAPGSSCPTTKPGRIFVAATSAFEVVRRGGMLVLRAPRESFVRLIDEIGQGVGTRPDRPYKRNKTTARRGKTAMTTPEEYARDNNPEFRTWSLIRKLLGGEGDFNEAWGPKPRNKDAWPYREQVMENVRRAGIFPMGTLPAKSTKSGDDAFAFTDYKRVGEEVWEMRLERNNINKADYDRLRESVPSS